MSEGFAMGPPVGQGWEVEVVWKRHAPCEKCDYEASEHYYPKRGTYSVICTKCGHWSDRERPTDSETNQDNLPLDGGLSSTRESPPSAATEDGPVPPAQSQEG